MPIETQKEPDFAENFVREKLIEIATESAKVGISAEVFEALVIALADELDFKDIM